MTRVNASRHAMRGGSGLPWWPAEGITWLLRDEFAMGRPAGSLNGTAAEPGPGTRTVVDTGSKITIAGGQLDFATGGTVGDGVIYSALSIVPGRLLLAKVSKGAAGAPPAPSFGFSASALSAAVTERVGINTSGVNISTASYTGVALTGAVTTSLLYNVAMARGAGNSMFVFYGPINGNWLLLWRNTNAVSGTTPAIQIRAIDAVGDVDWLRVPDTLWLPTPLVSDGFATAFGTSDGLGHAEGIATGIGAGGGGVAWTQQVGTWAVGSAKANAATLDGGIAIATASLATANVIMGVACVRSAGDVGVVLSWADSSNYVRALHNGTNVQLIKTVAGTPTTLINVAATYSAGARLVVTKDDTKYRVYYNNALVGTEQTIADAGIISNTLHGLFSTDAGNTLDDFVVYARGNEGQYSALDSYSVD